MSLYDEHFYCHQDKVRQVMTASACAKFRFQVLADLFVADIEANTKPVAATDELKRVKRPPSMCPVFFKDQRRCVDWIMWEARALGTGGHVRGGQGEAGRIAKPCGCRGGDANAVPAASARAWRRLASGCVGCGRVNAVAAQRYRRLLLWAVRRGRLLPV